jgi:hypothetical protein
MLCCPTSKIYKVAQGKMALCAFSGLTIYPDKIKANFKDKINPKHDPRRKPDGAKYIPSALRVYDH